MSKLNPQKASAYVGPGVLRKGGKITPVPNGPLIKKKGPFKGSGLKSGGTIKKAQNGTSEYSDPKPLFDKIKKSKDSLDNATFKLEEKKFKSKMKYLNGRLKNEESIMNTKKVKKAKAGAMIKRADGSMSRHGLWDSIRANKGSGKKPTAAMLKQEKKIKAKYKK
jgi:hypothetical protein